MPAKKKAKPEVRQVAVRGDCVAKLRDARGQVKLLIADPPYNFGQPYDSYKDNKSYDEYMTWTREWMQVATDALDPHGSMWVFCPDEWVSEIDILARKVMRLFKTRHVIWAFTFGQKAQRKFTRSHCHLLWLTKHRSKYTFNLDAVKVPSARQLVYNDKRAVAGGKPPDATWMLLKDQLSPYMGRDKDVWLESRVCGTFGERKKHSPNQIPVPVMERIVKACSDPGDLVVDPFSGTGASGVACAMHDRPWMGFDLSATCVSEGNRRIKAVLSPS